MGESMVPLRELCLHIFRSASMLVLVALFLPNAHISRLTTATSIQSRSSEYYEDTETIAVMSSIISTSSESSVPVSFCGPYGSMQPAHVTVDEASRMGMEAAKHAIETGAVMAKLRKQDSTTI